MQNENELLNGLTDLLNKCDPDCKDLVAILQQMKLQTFTDNEKSDKNIVEENTKASYICNN